MVVLEFAVYSTGFVKCFTHSNSSYTIYNNKTQGWK